MVLRLLPGILIAALLGVVFSLSDPRETEERRYMDPAETSACRPDDAKPAVASFFYSDSRRPAFSPPPQRTQPLLHDSAPAQSRRPNPAAAPRPTRSPITLTQEDLYAMAAPAGAASGRRTAFRPRQETRTAPNAAVPPVTGEDFRRQTPVRLASDSALAAPAGVFVPPRQQDMPPKGIKLWGNGGRYSERQKLRDFGRSVYTHKGDRYGFGINYDWSVDSVLGVSCDILEGTLKSRQENDDRKDEIKGYMLNAHCNTTLFGKIPFDLKFTYGRVKNRTEGWLHYPFRSVFWEEERHESDLYGVSGKVGFPLMLGNGVKMLTEIGVEYTRIRGKEFEYTINVNAPMLSPKSSASSLTVPVGVTFRYDFIHSWGLATPRLGLGTSMEFNEDAMAVKTFNSTAASRVDYVPNSVPLNSIAYDAARETHYYVTIGLDVATVGGWELSAEYSRQYAERFQGNSFKLELAKCF